MIIDWIDGRTMSASICVMIVASCSQRSLTPEKPVSEAETVVKEVAMKMASTELCSVAEETMTKTYLWKYDTVGVTREHMEGRWYDVGWKAGDKTYCYCQTGVYMSYVLTDEDMIHGGRYSGESAKTHVIYRVGDSWIVVYCKGSKIGNHIGSRAKERLVLENGVPRDQNGNFEDCHICLVRASPDDDKFEFENMQAYIRFEVTQSADGSREGKLLGNRVTKVTIQSLSNSEKMAGNVEIVDDGGWRTILLDRSNPADSMITVIPNGGMFEPSPSLTTLKNYFVAVPARRYSAGIRFLLYTKVAGTEAVRGYVDIPGTTITKNQILNIHDLLKYCALYVDGLTFSYGPDDNVETSGIKMVAGHSGKITVVCDPTSATDRSLKWDVDDNTVCTVAQDGTVTALATGIGRSCKVTATAKDRGIVTQTVTVTVTPDASLAPGGYSKEDFGWPTT